MTDIVTENTVRQAPKRRLPDFGRRNEKIVAGLTIAPGQLLMFFIVAFPAAVAIYIGFTEWTPTSGDNVWGAYHYWHWFDGYWEALTSGSFWHAMWLTVWFMLVAVGVEFADRLRARAALPEGVPRPRAADALLPAADDGRPGRLRLHLLHDLPGRRPAEPVPGGDRRPRRRRSTGSTIPGS